MRRIRTVIDAAAILLMAALLAIAFAASPSGDRGRDQRAEPSTAAGEPVADPSPHRG